MSLKPVSFFVYHRWTHEVRMPRQLRSVQRVVSQSIGHDALALAPSAASTRGGSAASSSLSSSSNVGQAGEAQGDAPSFQPRRAFALPAHVPSWYAGHMYRAMRSLPALLSRQPPPLIIETRDARLPLSSINPAFEEMLSQMEESGKRSRKKKHEQLDQSQQQLPLTDVRAWKQRRLVVYNKADLIDKRLYAPLKEAFARHQHGQDVMFVDSRSNADVRKVIQWARRRAAQLAETSMRDVGEQQTSGKEGQEAAARSQQIPGYVPPRSARKQNLSGAFRHTTTPDDGVRLVILGMPNVGKSSLLNALRRIGTGGGKAASTAPEPGHTRKLTGTVRITRKTTSDDDGGRMANGESVSSLHKADGKPAIYVYDTPGVMVPFLGGGVQGAEKGVKLAVAAGIKSSLFDAIGLADYLLFRLNLKYFARWHSWRQENNGGVGSSKAPEPAYVTGLPLGATFAPTNNVEDLLSQVALRAPGTLSKGGERDLDASATFMIDRWRAGKLGSGELDTGAFEWSPLSGSGASEKRWTDEAVRKCVDEAVQRHFAQTDEARQQGVATSHRPVRGADRASRRRMESVDWHTLREQHDAEKENRRESNVHSWMSKRQDRLRSRAIEKTIRANRLRAQGVRVEGLARPKRTARGVRGEVAAARSHGKPSLGDRQAASRARRSASARAGVRMSKRKK